MPIRTLAPRIRAATWRPSKVASSEVGSTPEPVSPTRTVAGSPARTVRVVRRALGGDAVVDPEAERGRCPRRSWRAVEDDVVQARPRSHRARDGRRVAELVDVRVVVERERRVARSAGLRRPRRRCVARPANRAPREDHDAEVRHRPREPDGEDLLGACQPRGDGTARSHLRVAIRVHAGRPSARVARVDPGPRERSCRRDGQPRHGDTRPERDPPDTLTAREDDRAGELAFGRPRRRAAGRARPGRRPGGRRRARFPGRRAAARRRPSTSRRRRRRPRARCDGVSAFPAPTRPNETAVGVARRSGTSAAATSTSPAPTRVGGRRPAAGTSSSARTSRARASTPGGARAGARPLPPRAAPPCSSPTTFASRPATAERID